MRKIFTTLLIVFIAIGTLYSQDLSKYYKSPVKDNGNNVTENHSVGTQRLPTLHNPFAPSGNIPFPLNYNDYGTNGNNMRKVFVIGNGSATDTIVVATDINPDMTGPPPVTTTTRLYYQVSVDGGVTWLPDAVNSSPATSNRWPNIFPIYNSGLRSLIILGRIYNNNSTGDQRGLASVETMLGLGSFTSSITTANFWRDYFGGVRNSTTAGGVLTSPNGSTATTDTMWYMDFNYVTNTFGTARKVDINIDANFRYSCDVASNGQNIAVARWKGSSTGGDQAYYVHESTDGGVTWSAATKVGNSQSVNGDSCVAWLSQDLIYKPGTTIKCLAFSTLYGLNGSNYATREGSKILFWSPGINGGNPVVIIDYHKYGFMNDTALYNNYYVGSQVGMTPLSHPSLAFSADGSVLYCAFSAMQKDSSAYPGGAANFNHDDIFICMSTDNGATWSDAKYVTKTKFRDETYPTLSKTGNTASMFNIVYNESGSPGSFTFNNNAPADTTYTVFKRIAFSGLEDVPKITIGIQNISSEVPAKFSLMQNYPNPFNPTTTIKFAIPKASLVTIKVYNVTGQLVAVLAENESTNAGIKEVKFSGEKLASGIYFYTLQAGDFKETKKMMLIK